MNMDISLWITNKCNLSCDYCYESKNQNNISMNKKMIRDCITFSFQYLENYLEEDIRIQIHGGEPFLEFDNIKYLVDYVKQNFSEKVSFLITTNGTVMNENIMKFIVKELKSISISIDGQRKTHDRYRKNKYGVGSFDIAFRNAKMLLNNGVYVRIRSTFNSYTVKNLYEDINFFVENGFKTISSVADFSDNNWNETSLKELQENIEKIKILQSENLNVNINIVDKNSHKANGICYGGKKSLSIYSDGSIFPCTITTGKEYFCIGNIYSGIDYKKLDYFLGQSHILNLECEGCKLYFECKSTRCKLINRILTGDFHKPTPIECELKRLYHNLLG